MERFTLSAMVLHLPNDSMGLQNPVHGLTGTRRERRIVPAKRVADKPPECGFCVPAQNLPAGPHRHVKSGAS